jgi:hypothetical protein
LDSAGTRWSSQKASAAAALFFVGDPVLPEALPPGVAADDVVARLLRVVGEEDEVQILLGDLPLRGHAIPEPLHETLPVADAHQHHREVPYLAGLDEREGLEELVHRAEPSREDHEGLRVLHEHGLAHEEVPEVDGEVDEAVAGLLEGQLDVAPDGQRARLPRSLVGRLHDAGTTAGDDGESGFPEEARGLDTGCVLRVVRGRAGRPEDGNRGSDLPHLVESLDELSHDPEDPPRILTDCLELLHALEESLVLGPASARKGLGPARSRVVLAHRPTTPSLPGVR